MDNENKSIIVGEDGSYFDGGYLAYIGYNIAVSFVSGITFGIAHPWVRCWYQKWLASHTVINGKRLTFDGNGGDLFVKYIVWMLLTIVTCGIYGFWMNVALKKWMTDHTHFEDEPDQNSFFDGKVGDYFIAVILSALAALVPFAGIAWSNIIITRWFINHTVIDSRRLTFRGTVGDLFLRYLLWGFLTSITCGIFALFAPVKYIKWETEHTLDSDFTPEALNAKANYKTQVHTDAVMLQSGDNTQLENIRAQMLLEANEGLEQNDLPKLESAIRLSDILRECGVVFSAEENELLSGCIIAARRLKAEKPIQTKSKVWVIVVAAIVGVLMFLGVIGGGVAAGLMFMNKADLRSPVMSYDYSPNTFNQKIQFHFMDRFSNSQYSIGTIKNPNDNSKTRILKNQQDEKLVTFTVFEGVGPTGEAEITGVKVSGPRVVNSNDNEDNIETVTKILLDALYIEDDIFVAQEGSIDEKIDEFWAYKISNDASQINIEISRY